jgi:hypothetical protein
MNRCIGWLLLALTVPAVAATVPAGTELNVRMTDKIATETTKVSTPVHATVIAPVILDGAIAIPAGVQINGIVKQVTAATDTDAASLELLFSEIRDGAVRAKVSTIVVSLDNARESVDAKGVINGISPKDTISARLDQGISKLQANDKLAQLAGLIQGAKQALKIEDANPNIDFDPGVEFTLRLTQPLEWRVTDQGAVARILPFPNQDALADLVNRQPFRTVAQSPSRPSDMTNIMFLATEDELRAAFEKAGWSAAARLDTQSKLETARALIEARGYKEGPMSVLLLDGQPPDLQFQKGNNTFAQRHHLRIFRRPGTFDGKPIWVCSSTHDTGIDFSERDRTFIHKVDSQIDRERAKVVNDLIFTGAVRSLALVPRPDVPQNLTNATGDTLTTDGAMAVLLLQ